MEEEHKSSSQPYKRTPARPQLKAKPLGQIVNAFHKSANALSESLPARPSLDMMEHVADSVIFIAMHNLADIIATEPDTEQKVMAINAMTQIGRLVHQKRVAQGKAGIEIEIGDFLEDK